MEVGAELSKLRLKPPRGRRYSPGGTMLWEKEVGSFALN